MRLTYFIADAHGFVKIGKSTRDRLRLRMDTLQTAHAEPLTLLAVTTASETTCHALFASLHVRGEWFRLEPSLLDWLAVNGVFDSLHTYPKPSSLNAWQRQRKREREAHRRESIADLVRRVLDADSPNLRAKN